MIQRCTPYETELTTRRGDSLRTRRPPQLASHSQFWRLYFEGEGMARGRRGRSKSNLGCLTTRYQRPNDGNQTEHYPQPPYGVEKSGSFAPSDVYGSAFGRSAQSSLNPGSLRCTAMDRSLYSDHHCITTATTPRSSPSAVSP